MKFEIPDECKIRISKKTKIEKLDGKFLLISHPHPSFEGELLILQPKKADQDSDSDEIVYRDYSLKKRLPTKEKSTVGESKIKSKKSKESETSKLACLEIVIEDPINHIEWQNLAEVLNMSQGLGWFQTLPVNQKSS